MVKPIEIDALLNGRQFSCADAPVRNVFEIRVVWPTKERKDGSGNLKDMAG